MRTRMRSDDADDVEADGAYDSDGDDDGVPCLAHADTAPSLSAATLAPPPTLANAAGVAAVDAPEAAL